MFVVADLADVVGTKQLLDERHEPHRVDGLLQVVAHAELQRLDGARNRPLARDEHDGGRRFDLAQLADQIDAARPREMQIRHHQIDRSATENLQRLLGGIGGCDFHPERGQHRS
jgi:hypothetical protein